MFLSLVSAVLFFVCPQCTPSNEAPPDALFNEFLGNLKHAAVGLEVHKAG